MNSTSAALVKLICLATAWNTCNRLSAMNVLAVRVGADPRIQSVYSTIRDADPPAYDHRDQFVPGAQPGTPHGIKHAPRPTQGGKSPAFQLDDAQFLHHHGGAVLLLARRQCAADRCYRTTGAALGSGVDDAAAQVLFYRFLRRARPVRGR